MNSTGFISAALEYFTSVVRSSRPAARPFDRSPPSVSFAGSWPYRR